jgi:hypothetical protein
LGSYSCYVCFLPNTGIRISLADCWTGKFTVCIDKQLPTRSGRLTARVPTDRIDDRCADCVLLRKSYAISTPQVLLDMEVLAPIPAFMSAHYTIKDLLDPSVP